MQTSSKEFIDHTPAIVTWLEGILGPVESIKRQARWRPMWFATVNRNGKSLNVCVRGERSDCDLTWPLKHEMIFQDQMFKGGLKTPEVYGWNEELQMFAMESVIGRPDFKGVAREDSDRIVDEYVQELAKLHAFPVEPFIAAGIRHPENGEDPALIGINRMEQMYRDQKNAPNPFLEWVFAWLRRHPVDGKGRAAPIVWDSGQFHHDGKNFVAILDVELGHIGDPMMDLAGWRMRDSVIPFGDFDKIYERYGQITGKPVDIDAIQWHHIAFTLSNYLSFAHRLNEPIEDTDFGTYLQWCNETNIYVTEALGEYLGVSLPEVEMPEPRKSRFRAPNEYLKTLLRTINTDDEYVRYQTRIAFRVAQHLARVDEIGEAITNADLDDATVVLKDRPADWIEGERELEKFVLADKEGKYDDDLLWLFHRRNVRAQMMNGPAGSAMARHNPIQAFKPRKK